MNLPSPVSIQPPAITRADGEVRTFQPFTLSELDVTITDSVSRKLCTVNIRSIPRPLVLWAGDAYDAAGDYTQAQVEARVLELLGNDPKSVLEGLFQFTPPTPPNVPSNVASVPPVLVPPPAPAPVVPPAAPVDEPTPEN